MFNSSFIFRQVLILLAFPAFTWAGTNCDGLDKSDGFYLPEANGQFIPVNIEIPDEGRGYILKTVVSGEGKSKTAIDPHGSKTYACVAVKDMPASLLSFPDNYSFRTIEEVQSISVKTVYLPFRRYGLENGQERTLRTLPDGAILVDDDGLFYSQDSLYTSVQEYEDFEVGKTASWITEDRLVIDQKIEEIWLPLSSPERIQYVVTSDAAGIFQPANVLTFLDDSSELVQYNNKNYELFGIDNTNQPFVTLSVGTKLYAGCEEHLIHTILKSDTPQKSGTLSFAIYAYDENNSEIFRAGGALVDDRLVVLGSAGTSSTEKPESCH